MDHTSTLRLNSAGAKFSNYVFRPSSIYDVDPSIGGATCYGYTEYEPFYTSYRVYASTIQVFCSNLEAEGNNVFLLASETSPGNNVADLSPYFAHPRARYLPLGPYQGNAAGRLSASCTTQAISGVSTFAADEYTGVFGSSPANNWFWIIGTYKAGNNLVYGVDLVVKIKITVDLFDRKIVTTGLTKLHQVPADAQGFPPPIPVYMVSPPIPPLSPPPPLHNTLALFTRSAQAIATPQV